MPLATETAEHWLTRWDRQQEGYLPDRETVFAVIADAVATLGRPDPLVLDLGCGPGSLGARILARLPEAEIVGVDTDPVLLALAEAAYPIRFVDHDLRDPEWVAALGIDRPVDAIVSTTALHWLYPAQLATVYSQAYSLLRPGGLLLNGDGMRASSPAFIDLHRSIGRAQIERAGVADREEWEAWWTAIKAEPELTDALAERDRRRHEHPEDGDTGYDAHVRALRDAGFGAVGPVWQYGSRRILAGIKN